MAVVAFAAPPASAEADVDLVLTDFAAIQPAPWRTVNDNVMGGRSRGGGEVTGGVLRFRGATNTDGGGFSSLRAPMGARDLSEFDGIRVKVRGDGRRYTFRLTSGGGSDRRFSPAFWAQFQTSAGAWQVVDLPFGDFEPRWRGQPVPGARLDHARIDSLGVMIYDGRDGPFALDIDWVGAYRGDPLAPLTRHRWERRPLLLFAPSLEDPQLQAQLRAVFAVGDGFVERDMLLVIATERGEGHVGNAALSERQMNALRRAFDVTPGAFALRLVGKDGGVKRAASAPVMMQALFAQIDAMPMRQREMRAQRAERGG